MDGEGKKQSSNVDDRRVNLLAVVGGRNKSLRMIGVLNPTPLPSLSKTRLIHIIIGIARIISFAPGTHTFHSLSL